MPCDNSFRSIRNIQFQIVLFFSSFFNRESDFEGVRITEVIKSRLPLETVVIKDMEVYQLTYDFAL